jgi:hypothetical protein
MQQTNKPEGQAWWKKKKWSGRVGEECGVLFAAL